MWRSLKESLVAISTMNAKSQTIFEKGSVWASKCVFMTSKLVIGQLVGFDNATWSKKNLVLNVHNNIFLKTKTCLHLAFVDCVLIWLALVYTASKVSLEWW